MTSIRILPFRNKHQTLVDRLIGNISTEFELPITSSSSIPMKNVAHVIGNQFWVAMHKDVLIASIGIMRMGNKRAVVKSMFVAKEYRGKDVAALLLDHAMKYCLRRSIEEVYLGTMSQMKAAQKFYEKNGFVSIEEKEVPIYFGMNPLDDVFYKLELVSYRL